MPEKDQDKNQNNDISAEIEKLKNVIAEREKERDEYLGGWKRAKADLSNYKKEEQERFSTIARFSEEGLIKEIIIVLDSFDLGLISWKEESQEKKGMTLIRLQLEDALKKFGLERITVKSGENFNPAFHECLFMVDGDVSGTIVEEVERGYILNGKVVRPSRVKVAK